MISNIISLSNVWPKQKANPISKITDNYRALIRKIPTTKITIISKQFTNFSMVKISRNTNHKFIISLSLDIFI